MLEGIGGLAVAFALISSKLAELGWRGNHSSGGALIALGIPSILSEVFPIAK